MAASSMGASAINQPQASVSPAQQCIGQPASHTAAQRPPPPPVDYRPGYPSAFAVAHSSTPHPLPSSSQVGHGAVTTNSGMDQSTVSVLPPNKQSTWSSDDDSEAEAETASRDDLPPGYAASSAHRPDLGQVRSSRAAANSLMQADADQPPGFTTSHAAEIAPEQGIAPGSVRGQPNNRHQPGFSRQDRRRAVPSDGSASQQPLHSESDSSVPKPAQRSVTEVDGLAGSLGGADHRPGFFSQSSLQQQSAQPRHVVQSTPSQQPVSVRIANGVPSRDDHPPGFTQPSMPPTHTQQGNTQDPADQPAGFRQPGSQQRGQRSSAQLSTPASAHAERTRNAKPTVLPVSTRGNKSQTGRAEAGVALSPAPPTGAAQFLPAASQASAASISPFSQLAQDRPPGFLAPHPHGRTATSSLAQTPAISSLHPASGDPDMPPGFPAASSVQPFRQGSMGSQQHSAGLIQTQKATQALPQPQASQPPQQQHQQQQLQQQLPQAAEQKPGAQGIAPKANQRDSPPPPPSASATDDLPPGFAPQSHPSASTPQPAPKPALKVAQRPPSAGSLTHAPRTVTVTGLPSTSTPGQKPFQQPSTSASAADDAPPGFAARLQQPVSASRLALESPQQQSPVVAPLQQQKIVTVTKLSSAPSPGPSSAPPVIPPLHAPKIVSVTRLPVTSGARPSATSSKSSSARSVGNTQALPQSSVAAALVESDVPPGFSTMQRSASAASTPAAAALGSASSVPVSGFVQPSSAEGSDDVPPGFPAASASMQLPKPVNASKGSRGQTGRNVVVPQPGMQRSDARRKAQISKVRCTNTMMYYTLVCFIKYDCLLTDSQLNAD